MADFHRFRRHVKNSRVCRCEGDNLPLALTWAEAPLRLAASRGEAGAEPPPDDLLHQLHLTERLIRESRARGDSFIRLGSPPDLLRANPLGVAF